MCATNERLLNVSTETPQRQNLVAQLHFLVVVAGIEMHLAGAARVLKP
jgi:hypothetical protein